MATHTHTHTHMLHDCEGSEESEARRVPMLACLCVCVCMCVCVCVCVCVYLELSLKLSQPLQALVVQYLQTRAPAFASSLARLQRTQQCGTALCACVIRTRLMLTFIATGVR